MKRTVRFLLLLAVGTALPSLGQVTSSSPSGQGNSDFEELPELKVNEILKPEVFQGPHHTVRELVPTSSGMVPLWCRDYNLFARVDHSVRSIKPRAWNPMSKALALWRRSSDQVQIRKRMSGS